MESSASKITKVEEKTSYNLFYWMIRGRAEPIRLALSLAGQSWNEVEVDEAEMKAKAGSEAFPFGQCPILEEIVERNPSDVKRIPQMDGILRRLGRRYGFYNGSEDDLTNIDSALSAVEAIRSNYLSLIYRDELSEDAKAKYFTKHVDPTTVTGQNGGAHFGFLESLAERAKKSESQKFYVSSSPSIADIQLYDVFDVHHRIYGDKLTANYPRLASIYKSFGEVPQVAEYLKSEKRPKQVNGNPFG